MADTRRVTIGFIGCGGHGSFLQSLIHKVPQLELVAVCDIDKAKADRNAKNFGAAECHYDHRKMLKTTAAELIAVVGTPQMHAQIGCEVLQAGKHLFVEKPLGVDFVDCKRLAQAAAASGKIVMNGYMWRYGTPIARLKAISKTSSFGKPMSFHARFLTPQPRFSIWGLDEILATCVICDGGHPIDIAMFLLGPIEKVQAWCNADQRTGVTSLASIFEFSSGSIGTLHTGTCTSGVDLDFMLTSNKGYTIKLQDNMNRMFYIAGDKVDYQNVPIVEGWYPAALTVTDADHTGWTAELAMLAKCIIEGQQPENDMQAGLEVMRVMQAVKTSFTEKRTVAIGEIK